MYNIQKFCLPDCRRERLEKIKNKGSIYTTKDTANLEKRDQILTSNIIFFVSDLGEPEVSFGFDADKDGDERNFTIDKSWAALSTSPMTDTSLSTSISRL